MKIVYPVSMEQCGEGFALPVPVFIPEKEK